MDCNDCKTSPALKGEEYCVECYRERFPFHSLPNGQPMPVPEMQRRIDELTGETAYDTGRRSIHWHHAANLLWTARWLLEEAEREDERRQTWTPPS